MIKQERKRLGISQEALADEEISTGTISHMKSGGYRIGKEKVECICKKLNMPMDELFSVSPAKTDDEEDLEFELITLEHTLDRVDLETGWKDLQQIQLDNRQPLIALVHYLRGKYYLKKREYEQAQVHFSRAVQAEEDQEGLSYQNIKSASFYELARIAFDRNDLKEALDYVQKGLDAFVAGGEREYYLYHLLVSQVIYLKNQNRIEEA